MKATTKTSFKTLGPVLLSIAGLLLSVFSFLWQAVLVQDSYWYRLAERTDDVVVNMFFPALYAMLLLSLVFAITSLVRRSWFWALMTVILPVVISGAVLIGVTIGDAVEYSEDPSWRYVEIPKPDSTGTQDFPTYTLRLYVNGKSYRINDYWKKPLYGCGANQDVRNQGTEAPVEAISDHLCYVMGTGDLFTVVRSGDKYTVMHALVGDVPEKQEPTILFTI